MGRDIDSAQIICTTAEYEATNKHLNALLYKLAAEGLCQIIHQEKALLQGGIFHAWKEGGKLLMSDHFHLSYEGSILSVEGIKDELLQFIQLP